MFDTLAVRGGTPRVTRVEKVTKVPDPTRALMPPAATAATKTASHSHPSITASPCHSAPSRHTWP